VPPDVDADARASTAGRHRTGAEDTLVLPLAGAEGDRS